MSSHAYYEADTQAEEVARNLNSDFQFIADRLPTAVKESSPHDTTTLCAIEGIGKLWAKYAGSRPDQTGRAISEYIMKVGVMAEGQDGSVQITQDFGLTYQTLHCEGPLDNLEPIRGEDLAGCPMALGALEFAARSLREEFARIYSERLESTEEIIQLDAYRGV